MYRHFQSPLTVAQKWRMAPPRRSRPLDPDALQRLAIGYVGRYATTQAKLEAYLRRKIAERGWDDPAEPPIAALVARCADAGFVDDQAFAEARSAALVRRGFGARRIGQALAHAGIARDVAERLLPVDDDAVAAARAFARRRRLGPYASGPIDDVAKRRGIAAMIRAGHSFELARRFTQRADSEDEI